MKNSNEMSNAVCDNCGALINSDCNSVSIEINQVPHELVRVAANSPHAMNAKPQIIDDLWFFYF